MKRWLEIKSDDLVAQAKLMTPGKIKSIRKLYGVTQNAFADLINVSYHTYKNWEIGHRNPCTSAVALLLLAEENPQIFFKKRKQLIKLVKSLGI